MRRALSHGWYRWLFAAILLVLVFVSPIASHATPIIFRIFNLGESTAYVVQRNARTLSTQATSSAGVLAGSIDAGTGDEIAFIPDIDLVPPLPPSLTSAETAGSNCVHVAWTPSGDPSVVGYRISYGVWSVARGQVTEYQYAVTVAAVSSFDVCSLAGTYYFSVQAVNQAGLTSAYSNEMSVQTTSTTALISRFDALAVAGGVHLSWRVESDENITGFLLYRRVGGGNEQPILDAPLARTADSYVDTDVEPGTSYTYVLVAVSTDDSEVRSAPATATTPSIALSLGHNAPNPFRSTTQIPFTLDTASHVSVRVYDVTGALITTLVDGPLSQGAHDVGWDGLDSSGRRVASGAYFYTLTSGTRMQSRKMLLVR